MSEYDLVLSFFKNMEEIHANEATIVRLYNELLSKAGELPNEADIKRHVDGAISKLHLCMEWDLYIMKDIDKAKRIMEKRKKDDLKQDDASTSAAPTQE